MVSWSSMIWVNGGSSRVSVSCGKRYHNQPEKTGAEAAPEPEVSELDAVQTDQ